MIALYQFPPVWDVPNPSPFCMRVETYLRMTGLPYKRVYVANPNKSPKGKLPHIEDGDVCMGDSGLIIDYLKQCYGDPLDQKLSATARATAHAIERMLNEHFFWSMVYCRWSDEAYWPITKKTFFGRLPWYKRWFVACKARKNFLDQLYGHGLGRHTRDEIYQLAIRDLEALCDFLADKPFIMGTEPSSADATVYGYLANVLWPPHETPLKQFVKTQANLVAYCERMKARFYGDNHAETRVVAHCVQA